MQAVPANTILKVGLFKMRRRECPLNMDANEGRIYRVADLSDGGTMQKHYGTQSIRILLKRQHYTPKNIEKPRACEPYDAYPAGFFGIFPDPDWILLTELLTGDSNDVLCLSTSKYQIHGGRH